MLVYLDNYRKARTGVEQNEMNEIRLKNGTYGDEVMNANWNPSAALYALHIPPQQALSPELPADLSKIDLDSFMNRIYALATQV